MAVIVLSFWLRVNYPCPDLNWDFVVRTDALSPIELQGRDILFTTGAMVGLEGFEPTAFFNLVGATGLEPA